MIRKTGRYGGVIAALLAVASCGQQTRLSAPPAAASPVDPAAAELVALFADLCLKRFPDDSSVDQEALKRGFTAMNADQVSAILHRDPGHGWQWSTGEGVYNITVEHPPYHACAVRRSYAPAPRFETDYQTLLKSWVADRKLGALQEIPYQPPSINGTLITEKAQIIVGANGKQAHAFMAITTNYLNGQFEVRLVHQIPPG